MFNQTPHALIATCEDEALTHGQVMYGLIKPTKDMEMIESTAAQVNVIPKKRIYRMEKHEEIDLFMSELMKRPLVIQPSAHIGRGLAAIGCTLYTREERWIVMINQMHPKIQGRIQMGIDMAKAKMSQGLPFVLELSFNAFLKRMYLDRLTKASLNKKFTFIEFEDAEIIIRYPGDRFHRMGVMTAIKNNDMRFDFEDLLPSEITRRTVSDAQSEWKSPALRVIMPDELHAFLPGWSFENIDPSEGVVVPEEEEFEEKGAVGGVAEEETKFIEPPSGKIVGRSRRKAQQEAATKYQVPVELHVPKANGPQVLHRGNMSPSSPTSPGMRGVSPSNLSPTGRSPYENLDRRTHGNEHAYEGTRLGSGPPRSPRSPHSPNRLDSPYEEMHMSRQYNQQHSPHGAPSPRLPQGVPSPRLPQSAQSPRTPHTPVSPKSQPRTPSSPQQVRMDDRYNTDSGNMKRQTRNDDRYNTSVNDNTRPSQKTYLTDDNDNDDGGFSRSPPRQPHNRYDANSNYSKGAELDRYGNPVSNRGNYNPSDRYTDSSDRYADRPNTSDYGMRNQGPHNLDRPSVTPRDNRTRSGQPVPAPRGFHRQQGSGRSDTSTSDSGFGEIDYGTDSSKHRSDKYGAYSNGGIHNEVKTPYYNHAFENDPDSPVRDANVDDILAKHKAMAAQTIQMKRVPNSGSNYNRTDRYNDPNYAREVKKLRENINGLHESAGVPDVHISRSRLQSEPMEESFI